MSIEWIEPIFDRTSADVTNSKLKVQEWIKALASGESVDITDLKGFLNPTDLNRIENNTKYLQNYSTLTLQIKTDWSRTSLPSKSDIDRIISNISSLITELELDEITYEMPTTLLTYRHANTLEHNLSIIKLFVEDRATAFSAIFTNIDSKAEMTVVATLSLPFNTAFEKFNTETKAKIVDTKVISVANQFDDILIRLTTKMINPATLPVRLKNKVEIGLSSKTINSPSIPVEMSQMTEYLLNNKVITTLPISIKEIPGKVMFGIEENCIVLSPTFITLTGSILSDVFTEVVAYAIDSDNVKATLKNDFAITKAKMSFASMFVQSIFETTTSNLDCTIRVDDTTPIKGENVSTFTASAIVKLFAYAKLSDYASTELESMDSQTLQFLSVREIN